MRRDQSSTKHDVDGLRKETLHDKDTWTTSLEGLSQAKQQELRVEFGTATNECSTLILSLLGNVLFSILVCLLSDCCY